jgi:diacylglycerol kinase family enzyme
MFNQVLIKNRNMRKKETTVVSGASNNTEPMPLYYNPDSGSSEQLLELLKNDTRIVLTPVSPAKMVQQIQTAVGRGVKRLLISGGDGTIALAASHIAGTDTELAVIPSGTLNHFVQRLNIPINAQEALDIALYSEVQPVDVGYVNNRLFINTSSVGAYPTFVRSRKYLEHRLHYLPASIIAGLRRLLKFRSVRISLAGKQLRTPLVFIGVGERNLQVPALGQIKEKGQNGLHLIAINSNSKTEIFMLVMRSFFRGIDPMQKEIPIENQLVSDIELHFHRHRKRVHIALDGEVIRLQTPLKYHLASSEIMVAMPSK